MDFADCIAQLNTMTDEDREALEEMMAERAEEEGRYEAYYFDSTDMLTDYHARVL